MTINADVTDNSDAFLWRLAGCSGIVRKAATDVEANAKAAIQTGAKTGKTYKRGRKGTHQASAAGEAPATDTGALVNSISAQAEGRFVWVVTVASAYGAILELRRNRPFLLPALDKVKPTFEAALLRHLAAGD